MAAAVFSEGFGQVGGVSAGEGGQELRAEIDAFGFGIATIDSHGHIGDRAGRSGRHRPRSSSTTTVEAA
ncbi:hypothetical protein [Dactylosporangium sp. CA-233914]|uniref:hypothetical protein n=1 Tax=Dactylosporangium sp. CA-233914 TaxID=3239934 RepID=UPI003D918B6C